MPEPCYVDEHVQLYLGDCREVLPAHVRKRGRTRTRHTGEVGDVGYIDDGLRIQRSVIFAQSVHDSGINQTEKPSGILEPLISYACPRGGLILDPFAGSCSTLVAARATGRRAIGIERREDQCEKAVRYRLTQGVLTFPEASR